MASRLLTFHAKDLLDLLIHYNQGRDLPLYCELRGVLVSNRLERYLCLEVDSKDWASGDDDVSAVTGELKPLHYIYEGRRTTAFTNPSDDLKWHETPDGK